MQDPYTLVGTMKNNDSFQPVLVFGCRRSGTTLLRSMLAQHPSLLVHPKEPQFILTLLEQFGDRLRNVEKAVVALAQHPYLPETVDQQLLMTHLFEAKVQTWSDLIHAYLLFWAGKAYGQKQIVLKDPAFTFHLDALGRLFPSARYIHVVRHPYGNVSSQKARWRDASVWECAVWWKEAVTIGHQMATTEPERCLEVVYEDLVLAPEESLRRICQFLAIPFSDKMLDFTLETISFSPEKPPEAKQFQGLDPQRLERWHSFLAPEDIRLIEHCCAAEMAWWRYETLAPQVNQLAFYGRFAKERAGYFLLKNGRYLKQQLRQLKYRIMP